MCIRDRPITNLVDQIAGDDLVGAEGSFQNIIQDKIASALDSKKVEIANSVYNGIDVNDAEIDPETAIEDAEDPITDETTDSIEEN